MLAPAVTFMQLLQPPLFVREAFSPRSAACHHCNAPLLNWQLGEPRQHRMLNEAFGLSLLC